MIKKQKGQVVVLLLLVMVIALAVGLSTISRSTLEVSTSRKSEDSSRAFSAAEAGIEKIIQANKNNLGGVVQATITPFNLGNDSSAVITTAGLPKTGLGLAYPPFGKESFAQFWLVDSSDITKQKSYSANSFDIYFGDPDTAKYTLSNENMKEQPAIEVSTIYSTGSGYKAFSKYFDSYKNLSGNPEPRSGFNPCTSYPSSGITVNNNEEISYYCKATIILHPNPPSPLETSDFPVMVRVRILYSSLSHPVAIYPVSGNIPPQANIYISQGTSGSVQRTLKVFSQKSVMPQFFNYALFSASELSK